VLRKLKHLAPFHLRKQLAECLVLTKLDYCRTVFDPLPLYLTKRLTGVQCAAAAFVMKRYSKEEDVLKIGIGFLSWSNIN